MRSAVLCLVFVAVVTAAPPTKSVKYGRYSRAFGGPEQYSYDSAGVYVHDNSGAYDPRIYGEDTGFYLHDNSGAYDPNLYGGGEYASGNQRYASGNGIYSNVGSNGVNGAGGAGSQGAGSSASGVGVSSAASSLYNPNKNWAIIRKIEDVDIDGYHYLYETENKIYGEEEGHLANKGTQDEALRANGIFTYTGPDNVVYTVQYTADENGFVPSGEHLPTPPPTPEAILRSLQQQK